MRSAHAHDADGATILLVEDADAVRTVARRILERSGHRVLEAPDAESAIEVIGRGEPIDLLITDVVLPGMNGRELAELLARRRPGLRVLYTSGYTDDAVMRRGIQEGETRFLQKPFTPDGLSTAVRNALENGS